MSLKTATRFLLLHYITNMFSISVHYNSVDISTGCSNTELTPAPLSETSWQLPAELPEQQELLILRAGMRDWGEKAANAFFMVSPHTW